jgi:uncharacterized protein (DUF1697 family)
MPRYAAFLRGVSPMNLKMGALKSALEAAGFTEVRTLLSSGNAVFSGRKASESVIEKKVEAALEEHVGKWFMTIVRPIEALQALVDEDPFAEYRVSPKAKRIVSFVRSTPVKKLKLPIEQDGAELLCMRDRELLTAYVPSPKGPVFMTLIEKTFGKDITTRTWNTVKKVVRAGAEP